MNIMLILLITVLGYINVASMFRIELSDNVRFHETPLRAFRNMDFEMFKRSITHHSQLSGFDTLGGMGLGKRSEPEQAGEKRASLSTFDSLGGMGLGKRKRSSSNLYGYSTIRLSSLDTLAGMGFGRK